MADGHKSIKELLELMLANQPLFASGLCGWAWKLYRAGLITRIDAGILESYIDNNPPLFVRVRYLLYSGYYWECYRIAPRIKWINKHIKKNSK
jgi:hypothetical protein